MQRIALSLCFLLMSTFVMALPLSSPVPGGVAVVDLGSSPLPPSVCFDEMRVVVEPHEGHWYAIVGIPLRQAVGRAKLRVHTVDGIQTVYFDVQNKDYPTEQIYIAESQHANPNKENMRRIQEDKLRLQAVMSGWRDVRQGWSLAAPLDSPITGVFGARRVINDEPRSPHRGIDFKGAVGTPIKSAASGVVVEAAAYFLSGHTVVLDHGEGFYTLYSHLDKMSVAVGDTVKLGDIIGTVGQTGRATGPHLHFGVTLNGVRVDPTLFLPS